MKMSRKGIIDREKLRRKFNPHSPEKFIDDCRFGIADLMENDIPIYNDGHSRYKMVQLIQNYLNSFPRHSYSEYLVICDERNNPPNIINTMMNCIVYIKLHRRISDFTLDFSIAL